MVLSLPAMKSNKFNFNFANNRDSSHNNGYDQQKDLVRSLALSSNPMPTSPSEVKLAQIATPPPQTTNNSFSSNGLNAKNSNSNGNPSPPNNLNNSKTCQSPSPPNPQVIARTHSLSNSNDSVPIGSSTVRQISKLKRFLTTLYQFANDISTECGERVRALVIGLVNSTISTEDFHQKIQEITNYPLRPYVIPFLKLHLPAIQTDIVHFARLAKTSPAQYLREHESLILDLSPQTNPVLVGEPFEIFQRNDSIKDNHNKRRLSPEISVKENGFNDPIVDRDSGPPPAKRHQSLLSPTISSRTSPAGLAPLLLHHPTGHHSHQLTAPSILHSHLSTSGRSMFEDANSSTASALYHNTNNNRDNTTNGRNHSSHTSADHMNERYSSVDRFEREYCRPSVGLYSQIQRDFTDDRDMDEEWKNINTMLNCILGMVEKTKRALAILQHRSESRVNEFSNTALWNLPTLRSRHFNPLDVSHSTHSSHDFHELKKSRIDSLLSNHFQKTALSDIDRIADIRRIPGSHKQLEEAVNEVKRQAVVELQKAVSAAESKATELVTAERLKMEKLVTDARRQAAEEALAAITHQEDTTENCWNCGRKASETCSGCNVARYCGSFCQHKDWENHHRVCQNTATNGSNGSVTQTSISSEKSSPTPAPNSSNTSGSIGSKSITSAVSVSAGDLRDNKIKNE